MTKIKFANRVFVIIIFQAFCSLSQAQTSGIPFITVDQFGYLPNAEKVAVLSNPQTGFNASDTYTPGADIEVRKVSDSSIVFTGSANAWNIGITHNQSGDKAWWFDFSNLTAYGEYFINDPENDISSESFKISDLVYKDALRESVRTFYYQRCGIAKSTPYCDSYWSDGVCHHGNEQDLDCRLVTNPIATTSKDLSGGWHDAGDYNKYINYAAPAVHDLLFAYEFYPDIWHEDFSIPESGNGIADILDEVKYELDWMLKMQESNGSVLHKVSAINWDDAESPPSAEGTVRRYAPATASATISACGVFAHAAIIFKNHSNPTLQTHGQTLETAAISAWDWLMANPSEIPSQYNNSGFQNAAAENPEYTQYAQMVADAAFLLVLTNDTEYRTYFDNNYEYCHLFTWGAISYNFDDPWINDGLLYYENSPLATTSVVNNIKSEYLTAMNNQWADFAPLYALNNQLDAYRAFLDIYDWGSNQYKANGGTTFISMIKYGIDTPNEQLHENGAAGYIHYIHGVNPLAQNYLTNMATFGAESSVPEFYHLWFADGTDFDNVNTSLYGPPPGFLVGGPNENYSLTGQNLEPPENQPAQKSYLSWNTPEDASYEITENQIIYQAAYTRLLAHFISENSNPETENFLANPGAESGVSPCYCFASGPVIQQSVDEKHSGDYSFLSANRTQYYHGTAFNILPMVTGGQLSDGTRYTFSVWVKHTESTGKSLYLNIKQTDGSKGTRYITVGNEYCDPGIWTKLVGHHKLDYSGTLSNLELYVISGSGQTFDFFADDFFVGETENYTPPTSSTTTDFIRASGANLVVGASNDNIVLDGINVTVPVDTNDDEENIWDVKSISEKDFQNISDMGFNAIRLHLNCVMFEDDGNPGVFKEDGWNWLDRAISLAKEAGLFVLLDMHAPPGGYQSDQPPGFSTFWDGSGAAPNSSNQDRLIYLWAAIANRYKHEPAIAGYDLINEPRPNNSEEWYTYAEQIINEIRNYDVNHLICAEVPLISGYTMRLIDDDNVLYDSHFYYTWGYVTQYSAAYGNSGQEWGNYDPDDPVYVDWGGEIVPQGTPNSEAFDDGYLENYLLGDILTFTSANNVPANVGEFGIVWEAYAEDVGAMQYMRDLYNLLDGDNATGNIVSRFYFSYQGNSFGLYNNWTGFHTSEDEVSENLKAFFKDEFTWTGAQGTNWNVAANWITDLTPVETTKVIIPSTSNQPIISTSDEIIAKSVTVNSGANLEIASTGKLSITDELSNSGSLIVRSDASGTGSLIHNSTGVNATVQRFISAWISDVHGWHFLSSPVTAQAIQPEFVPNPPTENQDFFSWDEASATWINTKLNDGGGFAWNPDFETVFVLGKGYLTAYDNDQTKFFEQVLNVQDVTLTNLSRSGGDYSGWHLLGNPFSSAIAWNNGNWNMTNIAGTAKIWNESNASYTDIPANGIIPAMNGFMVQITEGSGSLTIPAASRTHDDQSWYKNSGYPKIKLLLKDLEQNTAQESTILFHPEATKDFDPELESRFLAGYAPQFYSVSGGEKLSVNAFQSFDENLEIPFHFIKNESGSFELQLLENNTGEAIYVEDLKTGVETFLTEYELYEFVSETGDEQIRFLIKFSSAGIAPADPEKIDPHIYGNLLQIINANNAVIEIFDLTGRIILKDISHRDHYLKSLKVGTGIYFLRIQNDNTSFTKKIYLNQ
ncbi:MAG: glycoside hydrolase family 9 protein [Bacteroidales bacterium]|nr:glycoside hydrolase family 9 protein [Bacteroidales bacterium]